MSRVLLVARRELASYTHSLYGWTIVALVLLLVGVGFNAFAMAGEKPSTEVISQFFYFCFILIVPASVLISMRTFAAEREAHTLVLLQTAPISEWEMVLGKFLGAYAFLLLLTLATVYMPLMVLIHGNLQLGQIAAGYLGLALTGACTTAVGLFASSLSRNQVLAVVLGGVMVALLELVWYLSDITQPPFDAVFGYMVLFEKQFDAFREGGVHLRSLVYFPTTAFVFLLASTRVLQSRRWR